MKKTVLALIMALSSSIALAVPPAPPASPLPNGGVQKDANVAVDVVKPLKIKLYCLPTCPDRALPYIYIGQTISDINRNIPFIITGMPTIGPDDQYPITVTHDGLDQNDGTWLYQGYNSGATTPVTMSGRWGSFDNGTVPGISSGTFEADNFPLVLSSTGQAFCNFIIDELVAAVNAELGLTDFYINVYAEYTAI